jgi:hypothetical protein
MSIEHSPARSGVRFGRIPDAQRRSGLGRSSLYKLAPTHPGLFRKHGKATIVDLCMLDEIMAALPVAEIKAPEEA